ncbi:MAG: hypothetical protein IJ604_02940 [Prevotella sp.]|nr:hypothetical protein [Prevotella sp.]
MMKNRVLSVYVLLGILLCSCDNKRVDLLQPNNDYYYKIEYLNDIIVINYCHEKSIFSDTLIHVDDSYVSKKDKSILLSLNDTIITYPSLGPWGYYTCIGRVEDSPFYERGYDDPKYKDLRVSTTYKVLDTWVKDWEDELVSAFYFDSDFNIKLIRKNYLNEWVKKSNQK